MTDLHELLVIGAGPAGCSAAVQAARMGLPVFLVDASGAAGGLARLARRIENHPGHPPLSGANFCAHMAHSLRRWGIAIHALRVHRVEGEQGAPWIAHTDAGPLRARRVVVATGTVPKPAPWPAHLVHPDIGPVRAKRPGTAAIIGGGEAACDFSLSLADRGWEVHLLVRGDRLRACAHLVEEVHAAPIAVHLGTPVAAVEERHGGVTVHTPAGPLRAEAVIAAIGRVPARIPLLWEHRPVDPEALTPAPGLFICGDVRRNGLGHAAIAIGEGVQAALSCAAEP